MAKGQQQNAFARRLCFLQSSGAIALTLHRAHRCCACWLCPQCLRGADKHGRSVCGSSRIVAAHPVRPNPSAVPAHACLCFTCTRPSVFHMFEIPTSHQSEGYSVCHPHTGHTGRSWPMQALTRSMHTYYACQPLCSTHKALQSSAIGLQRQGTIHPA